MVYPSNVFACSGWFAVGTRSIQTHWPGILTGMRLWVAWSDEAVTFPVWAEELDLVDSYAGNAASSGGLIRALFLAMQSQQRFWSPAWETATGDADAGSLCPSGNCGSGCAGLRNMRARVCLGRVPAATGFAALLQGALLKRFENLADECLAGFERLCAFVPLRRTGFVGVL